MRFQVEALKATVAVLLIVGIGMSAQSPAAHPPFDRFEVATVKPTPPDWAGGRFIRMLNADQFVARNHALKTLIAAAYNLSPKEISGGPEWVDSDRYDILAKTPGEVRPDLDEQMSMLRELLADRFKLAFHREQKEMSIYTLTITKSGPKLKESAKTRDASPAGPPPLIFVLSPHSARLPGRDATMGEFASVMQRALLDRPVVDRTGLTGRYDFDLEFMPDESQFGGALGKPGEPSDNDTPPGLFTAIQQQLGLRLEATKGPVAALVIDHVERPSAN
jgi:uncharacterized protein (TIGR03435 family)